MPFANQPVLRGGLLALLAALLFGISTPLVQRYGSGLGAFTTAALLYGGAAIVGALLREPAGREAALRRGDFKRLVCMALFGAVIGPVALAWGLQHTSGTSASLMLALEALFTVLLARLFYAEVMDKRVWLAMLLLLAGGVVLVLDRGYNSGAQLLGVLAVFAATLAWGLDNTLSRALADRDPGQVVLAKSLLGVSTTSVIALVLGESLPSVFSAVALLVIGGIGYGISLRFYLLAQRVFGAARTGSVFAFAPFIGAVFAITLGEQSISWGMGIGGLLMLAGVVLHLAESHGHEHQHFAMQHEHAHRHDDGHHEHQHITVVAGEHSHSHNHSAAQHTHPHAPDLHHSHSH